MPEGLSQARDKVGEAVDTAKSRITGEPPSAEYAEGRMETVRAALRAFGEGDVDGFLEKLGDDAEWVAPSAGHFPGGGEHKGSDAIRDDFVENVKRSYTSFGFRPSHFLVADREDWIVVVGAFEGQGVKVARGVEVPGVQVWEFDEHTVTRVRTFTDSAAFPEIVTEEDQRKLEEEERSEEEGDDDEKKGSGESDDREKEPSSESDEGEKESSSGSDEQASGDRDK